MIMLAIVSNIRPNSNMNMRATLSALTYHNALWQPSRQSYELLLLTPSDRLFKKYSAAWLYVERNQR